MTNKKKIAIIVCAIIVLAAAIIVPLTVHHIHKTEGGEAENSSVVSTTDAEEISLTNRETTTVEDTTAEPTTQAPTTTEAPATTVKQSVTTTKAPQTTKAPAPATTRAPQTTKAPQTQAPTTKAADSNKYPQSAINADFEEDAQIASGQLNFGTCSRCGRLRGHGSHGTCASSIMGDRTCPFCGKTIKENGCHTCS